MRNPLESIKFLSELRMRAWESAEYHARNNNESASEHARRQFDALGDAINVLGAPKPPRTDESTPSAQAGEVDWRWQFVHANKMRYMDMGASKQAAERAAEQDALIIEAAAPQPQGDASPQVSGGGEFDLLVKYGQHLEECRGSASRDCTCGLDAATAAALTPRAHEPAPTVDGGEGATHRCEICDYEGTPDPVVGCPRCQWAVMQPIGHPTPQANVARLVKALTLAANRMDRLALECPHGSAIRHDAHEWVGQARAVIAEQQEATNGQE